MHRRLLPGIGLRVSPAVALLGGCVSGKVLEVRRLEIQHIDIQAAHDGFTYPVEVAIEDHRIAAIDILANRDTSHAQKSEGVVGRVVEEQRNDVDVLAGATTTSMARYR